MSTQYSDWPAGGSVDKEIAARLGIDGRTASHHVSTILLKLDVARRAAAVARAFQLGLIATNNGNVRGE